VGKLNVAVLMGGKSDEREVSLSTGRMILGALDPEKYNAFPVDTARFGREALKPAARLSLPSADASTSVELLPLECVVSSNGSYPRPDVAFIALHGRFGEDGTVQGLLELLEIPYVGSGVLASALAMNKIMARKVLEYEGIPIPKGIAVRSHVNLEELSEQIERDFGFPAVVKPNEQGSTIGLSVVRVPSELPAAMELAFQYGRDVLIEEYIEGTEITGAVIGNEAPEVLPIIEIVPESGLYDYYCKYTPGATDEIVPARIPEEQYRLAGEIAIACHKALDCRGMSRTDMMLRGEDIYVLEVNTIPGMTPTSLLPRAAEAAGMKFSELLDRLIQFALERG
jgi:D-alanine-D-alanine ligase